MTENTEQTTCYHCGRPVHGMLFRIMESRSTKILCLTDAIRYPPWVRNAVKTAIVVGTLLALINHGNAYWTEPWTAGLALKTALTYCVPFGVAMWGALAASRIERKPRQVFDNV